MSRLLCAVCLLSASGCGLIWLHHDPTEYEKAVESRPSSRSVDGEVRDERTWALVRDAVVEASTDIQGYDPLVTLDGGRFHLSVDTLRKRESFADQMAGRALLGDLYDGGGDKVREVSFRARAGTRCSAVERHAVGSLPQGPVILWVRDCDERELARRP